MSPSAFIPFCGFGRNISAMKSNQGNFRQMHSLPICNIFQAKILNDQLCYEVDLDKYKDKDNTEKDLKSGLVFLYDYNEDRQVTLIEHDELIHIDRFDSQRSQEDENGFVYLNTIGNSDS